MTEHTLTTIATTHVRPPVPETYDEIRVIRPEPRRPSIMQRALGRIVRRQPDQNPLYQCGHTDVPVFDIDAYGTLLEPAEMFFTERLRCGNCEAAYLQKHSIRCAACRQVILEGERVSLQRYSSEWSGAHPDSRIILFQRGTPDIIICMRETCVDSYLDAAGIWCTDGYHSVRGTIERVTSLREYFAIT